ncbi:MAG: DNA ligase [Burkholderiales bacterium]|jgi:DNA ligase-1
MSLFARRRRPLSFGTTFVLLLFMALGFSRLPLLAADVPGSNALRITPVVPQAAPKPSPPPIPLANVLAPNIDVSKYLVSEKYDGVRAVWDGSVLRFRSGNVVNAPRWFLSKLPATPLDGELWIARGKFDQLSGVVRKSIPIDDEWRQVSYMIFEQPNGTGTFEERVGRIQRVVASANFAQLKAVEHFRVGNRLALKLKLDEVVKGGGEGLMLHLADAPYTVGRSDVLIKVKPEQDAEAVVIRHLPGEGKFAGMLGALEVKTPDGVVFRLGTGFSDAVRKQPPAVGATVTYRYRELTKNGVPRFASFLRERVDP